MDLPVTVSVMVRSRLGGLINSLRILDSVASGKPLSSISSSNCSSQSAFNVQSVAMATQTPTQQSPNKEKTKEEMI